MRRRAALPALALAALCAAGAPASAEALPKAKPGLWRMTTTGLKGGHPAVETRCVRTDDEPPFAGGPIPGGTCAPPAVSRSGAGHRIVMTCTIGDLVMTTTTTATGDPERRMRFDFVSEASGPAVALERRPKRLRTTIRSVRIGERPPKS